MLSLLLCTLKITKKVLAGKHLSMTTNSFFPTYSPLPEVSTLESDTTQKIDFGAYDWLLLVKSSCFIVVFIPKPFVNKKIQLLSVDKGVYKAFEGFVSPNCCKIDG